MGESERYRLYNQWEVRRGDERESERYRLFNQWEVRRGHGRE